MAQNKQLSAAILLANTINLPFSSYQLAIATTLGIIYIQPWPYNFNRKDACPGIAFGGRAGYTLQVLALAHKPHAAVGFPLLSLAGCAHTHSGLHINFSPNSRYYKIVSPYITPN